MLSVFLSKFVLQNNTTMTIIFSLIIQLSISLGLVPQDFGQMTQQEQIEYIREVNVNDIN